MAFSSISTVMSELHIGHFWASTCYAPDNHFIKHSSWKKCLQLGIFLIFVPLTKISMQMIHSGMLNSSIALLFFFCNLITGMSFLYCSNSEICVILRIEASSSALERSLPCSLAAIYSSATLWFLYLVSSSTLTSSRPSPMRPRIRRILHLSLIQTLQQAVHRQQRRITMTRIVSC